MKRDRDTMLPEGEARQGRRHFLLKTIGGGALVVAAPLSLVPEARASGDKHALEPTPPNPLGPFYKRDAPHRAVLHRPGDPGLALKISGRVLDVDGKALPRARLQVWQTNAEGFYDTVGNRYRAVLESNDKGEYALDSVVPGHYPARVCQHVHFVVQAAGCKPLVTEMYFATDPVFEGDPDANYHRDPLITSRDLVRPVSLKGKPGDIHAEVRFDLVLEAS